MTRQEIYELLRKSKKAKALPYYCFTGSQEELSKILKEPLPDDFEWYCKEGRLAWPIRDRDGTYLGNQYASFLVLKP